MLSLQLNRCVPGVEEIYSELNLRLVRLQKKLAVALLKQWSDTEKRYSSRKSHVKSGEQSEEYDFKGWCGLE
jgi:hypothetical protein